MRLTVGIGFCIGVRFLPGEAIFSFLTRTIFAGGGAWISPRYPRYSYCFSCGCITLQTLLYERPIVLALSRVT